MSGKAHERRKWPDPTLPAILHPELIGHEDWKTFTKQNIWDWGNYGGVNTSNGQGFGDNQYVDKFGSNAFIFTEMQKENQPNAQIVPFGQ